MSSKSKHPRSTATAEPYQPMSPTAAAIQPFSAFPRQGISALALGTPVSSSAHLRQSWERSTSPSRRRTSLQRQKRSFTRRSIRSRQILRPVVAFLWATLRRLQPIPSATMPLLFRDVAITVSPVPIACVQHRSVQLAGNGHLRGFPGQHGSYERRRDRCDSRTDILLRIHRRQ